MPFAGIAQFSPPASNSKAQRRNRTRIDHDHPMQRVSAQRIPDFNAYQLKVWAHARNRFRYLYAWTTSEMQWLMQKLAAVSTHLQACMADTPQNFKSWRALSTYLGMIPSLQDAAALNMAHQAIRILDFLKPIWSSEAAFIVPEDLLSVCVRLSSICRIEWLQKATLKCIVAITMNVAQSCEGSPRVSAAATHLKPGCLSLASLACNECDPIIRSAMHSTDFP